MRFLTIIFLTLIVGLINPASAQSARPYRLCAGADADSVYSAVAQDIVRLGKFSGRVAVTYVPDSMTAMDRLSGKECDAAFIQGDIGDQYYRANPGIRAGQSTVAGMHLEAYHIVAPMKVKDGFLSSRAITQVADLKGMTVGVTRSGAVSLRAINEAALLGLVPRVFDNFKEVAAALADGQVAAGLLVAGERSKAVGSLGTSLRILPWGDLGAKMKAKGYASLTVTYPGLTSGPTPLPATRAFILQRPLPKGELRAVGVELAEFLKGNLEDIRYDDKSHVAWNTVFPLAVADGAPALSLTK